VNVKKKNPKAAAEKLSFFFQQDSFSKSVAGLRHAMLDTTMHFRD
jgi:hypothetical protein